MRFHYDVDALISNRATVANRGAKNRHAYGKIPPKDLLLRMELQKYCCFYCHSKITLFTGEIEHFYPLSKGGEHYLYNIVWACHTCNTVKGASNPKRACKKLDLDYETIAQELAELNLIQHKLTQFDDEYAR